jgi:AraC family transcriptional regulator, regulatory protein of adaptative response / methylated-DNA-[protein]-cysteine methyltransferase
METPMLSPDRIPNPMPLAAAAADYDVVRKAIGHIRGHWREQPEIEAIAEAASVTPTELHHLFRRWAGLSPKAFLQALTLDGARQLLRDSASVLDATYEVGLSGPGRLHDLFVTHEAMSPGEWKTGGEGLTVFFGFHPSPFGSALVMATGRGLAGLAFADHGKERAALADMKGRWPRATYVEDSARTSAIAQRIFDPKQWQREQPLRVVLIGTDWEVRVWDTLLKIPMGKLVTYSDIACKLDKPTAPRAVGTAVGKSGDVTGYHWGITRKRAMLGWEAGQVVGAA